MEIIQQIRNFIIENFLYGDDSRNIDNEDSFFDNGIVDSTGVLAIVNFLEDHFHVNVADSEIMPENFDTIGRIAAYVHRKTLETAGS